MTILKLPFLLLSIQVVLMSAGVIPALAQSDAVQGHYADERNAGDLAAEESRSCFELKVCKESLRSFCPGVVTESLSDVASCTQAEKQCGAPETTVVHRFISKYGRGFVSANKEVLPSIKKVFSMLADAKRATGRGDAALPLSIRSRIPYVSKITRIPEALVKAKLELFFKNLSKQVLPPITIDYWGYFQQGSPLYPEVVQDQNEISSLMLSFRWCGAKFRFVDEGSTIIGNFLALAIAKESEIPRLSSPGYYTNKCEHLESWYPN